jgi:hypothetical protein
MVRSTSLSRCGDPNEGAQKIVVHGNSHFGRCKRGFHPDWRNQFSSIDLLGRRQADPLTPREPRSTVRFLRRASCHFRSRWGNCTRTLGLFSGLVPASEPIPYGHSGPSIPGSVPDQLANSPNWKRIGTDLETFGSPAIKRFSGCAKLAEARLRACSRDWAAVCRHRRREDEFQSLLS